MGKCKLCGSEAQTIPNYAFNVIDVKCPVCGRYINDVGMERSGLLDEYAAYAYHNSRLNADKSINTSFQYYFGNRSHYDSCGTIKENSVFISEEEILSFYPRTFSDMIDKILIAIDKKTQYIGQSVYLSAEEMNSLFFVRRFFPDDKIQGRPAEEVQIKEMRAYLSDMKYVSFHSGSWCHLLPNGLMRLGTIQVDKRNNKNIFVAMAFNEKTKPTREAIRDGIIQAGYSPTFVDEYIHGKQIIPEMLRLIRESRMLVIDISDPNFGAYYEAGYAQGMGKEVLFCCSQERFSHKYEGEEEKYQKYLKPHFDVAQRQMIIWKDTSELTHTLSEWIKVIAD